mmetsp:Transcript_158/g.438  ORF Transcript_158/g.438 Transcript_158/m.438 type:complete len:235 (-) Transcript_158:487-1191(-)
MGSDRPLRPRCARDHRRWQEGNAEHQAQVRRVPPRRGGGGARPHHAQGARGGDKGEEHLAYRHRQVRDGHVVLLALPKGVRQLRHALLVRVRPQLLCPEEPAGALHADEVQALPPAGRRDLPIRRNGGVRDRLARGARLLREPVPAREALPGPQDSLLRRAALPLLRDLLVRRPGRAHGWLLLQGARFPGGLQPGVHPRAALLPATRLRQVYDLVLLRALQAREEARHARETAF